MQSFTKTIVYVQCEHVGPSTTVFYSPSEASTTRQYSNENSEGLGNYDSDEYTLVNESMDVAQHRVDSTDRDTSIAGRVAPAALEVGDAQMIDSVYEQSIYDGTPKSLASPSNEERGTDCLDLYEYHYVTPLDQFQGPRDVIIYYDMECYDCWNTSFCEWEGVMSGAGDGGLGFEEKKRYAIEHGPWGFNYGNPGWWENGPHRKDWAYDDDGKAKKRSCVRQAAAGQKRRLITVDVNLLADLAERNRVLEREFALREMDNGMYEDDGEECRDQVVVKKRKITL